MITLFLLYYNFKNKILTLFFRAYSNVDIWVKHVGNLNNRVRVVHKSTNRVANNF